MGATHFDINKVKLGNNIGLHSLFYHLDTLHKWKHGKNFVPLFVDISPTSACNQNCFFCFTEWLRKRPKTIPEKLLIKIFMDMAKAGVQTCEIQGSGEPFINRALPDAIVAGKKHGMNICVVSNGVLLNSEILEKIMPCLSFYRISNLEHNAELYAKTHGSPKDHFQKAINALQEAVHIRNRDKLSTVITATIMVFDYNVPCVAKTTKMLKDIGVDIVHIKSPGIMHHNTDHQWETNTYEKFKDMIEQARQQESNDFKVNIRCDYFDVHNKKIERHYRKCFGVEFATHISSGAKIYPCYSYWEDDRYCLGDLNKHNFAKIWASEERKSVLKRFYAEVDPSKCTFHCKQHSPNDVLWDLANPPIHSDTF